MEIASDVRELLVGLKEPNTAAEQQVFLEIQAMHMTYCEFMTKLSAQVADLALGSSPEARVFFYQFQRAIYQDWTSTITECAFFSSPNSPSTLQRKLDLYEGVARDCMGSEDLCKCACASSLEANSNLSIEQCIGLYEAHRAHSH